MSDEAFRIEWDGERVKTVLKHATVDGLELAAEHLLQVATGLVPLQEGTLSRSGEVSIDKPEAEAAVSYDTPYAVVQHEDMTFNHDDGRQAKYLEGPMTSERETMLELIASKPRSIIR
jgi:Minor capsid protein